MYGGVSSAFEWPCWVKRRGRERALKWEISFRMLGRAVVVMERKTCCMSMTKRAVVILKGGKMCWGVRRVMVGIAEMLVRRKV